MFCLTTQLFALTLLEFAVAPFLDDNYGYELGIYF